MFNLPDFPLAQHVQTMCTPGQAKQNSALGEMIRASKNSWQYARESSCCVKHASRTADDLARLLPLLLLLTGPCQGSDSALAYALRSALPGTLQSPLACNAPKIIKPQLKHHVKHSKQPTDVPHESQGLA